MTKKKTQTREEYLQYQQEYRDSGGGKEVYRRWHLKRYYGITTDQYDEMYAAQGGCCACCGLHQTEQKYRLDVDHEHGEVGIDAVRGLLCRGCNLAIGKLGDNIEGVQNALDYLTAFYSGINRGD